MLGDDPCHLEPFTGTNQDCVGRRLEGQHVAGSTISCGPLKMQDSALPNGQAERSIVLAYHCARGGVDDRSGSLAELTRQKAAGVAVGDEADVVRVRFASNGESSTRGLVANLGLGRVADRE